MSLLDGCTCAVAASALDWIGVSSLWWFVVRFLSHGGLVLCVSVCFVNEIWFMVLLVV
jgi:hypothetical protein